LDEGHLKVGGELLQQVKGLLGEDEISTQARRELVGVGQ